MSVVELLATIEGTTRDGKPFQAGVVLWNDQVVEAAPIVRFMRRWKRDAVREHCRKQGWKISVVSESKRP